MDIYGCDKSTLTSAEHIYNILNELPVMLGMHKISEPQVTPYAGREESFDKGGISAFVLIAESHITIHTFVAQGSVFVDIFSCKSFDIDAAKRYIMSKFKAQKIDTTLLSRGREFPKDVQKAKVIVRSERRKTGMAPSVKYL